jgi:hypothetical protein
VRKNKEKLHQYEKLLKKKVDREQVSCNVCPFFQPEFRFRICLYTKCAFRKEENVFRDYPLKKDPFKDSKVVNKSNE